MRHLTALIPVLFCLCQTAFAQDPVQCIPETPTADGTTIIAWYTGQSIRVGSAPGQTMWNVVDDQSALALTEVHSVQYNYRDGITWCLFSADTDRSDMAPNTLFTNDPSFALRPPTEAEQQRFDTYIYPDTYCANHGGMFLRDVPPEEIPPCEEPTLIGVSDINDDGQPEFWGTEILKFATQIAVWDTARGYATAISACPGCAD